VTRHLGAGRHQSSSPLHRHTQINMHFSQATAKGDVSTLPARGHFYFALTLSQVGLTLSNHGSTILTSLKIGTDAFAGRMGMEIV
jgi:hypothetical protein